MNSATLATLAVENRRYGRFDLSEHCLLQRNERWLRATACNISKGGICVVSKQLGRASLGADLAVFLRGFEPIYTTMRWRHEDTYGLEFLDPISEHHEFAALIQELRISRCD